MIYIVTYTVKLEMFADINVCEFVGFRTIKVCDFRSSQSEYCVPPKQCSVIDSFHWIY